MITKRNSIVFSVISIIVLLAIYVFMPNGILQEPLTTPSEYLNSMPHVKIFGFILNKPSSTFFIFFLGIQTIVLGITFLKNRQYDTHLWWGIAMVFWGVGALLAGTSYQAFGYQLKCVDYSYCIYTSWFELAYYYVTALSMSSLGVAIAKTILPKNKRLFLYYYSAIAIIIYTILLLIGSVVSNKFLISYELFTLFFMPLYIVFFVYSVVLYKQEKDALNKQLITTWLLFVVVNASYYIYYFLGVGESLYTNTGIWFSANDVLHVALILWMGYIQFVLKRFIPKQ